jgi:hypothetical protein
MREAYTLNNYRIEFPDIFATDGGQVLDAGWHFSWMGDNGNRMTKWVSYAERAVRKTIPGAADDIPEHISSYVPMVNGPDPLGREDHKLAFYHWYKLPKMLFQLPTVKEYLLPGTKKDHFYFEPQMGESWFTFPNLYRGMVEWAPDDGARFVEVGVWKGRSAAFMGVEIANSGKNIEFYAVDHWKGSIEHQGFKDLKDLYEIYSENIERARPIVKDLRMPSLEAVNQFADGSLDFVFIDGSHEYQDVKDDIRAWLPKIRKGGVLAGHDYYPLHPEFSGVNQAVEEVLGKNNINAQEDCWIYVVNN